MNNGLFLSKCILLSLSLCKDIPGIISGEFPKYKQSVTFFQFKLTDDIDWKGLCIAVNIAANILMVITFIGIENNS